MRAALVSAPGVVQVEDCSDPTPGDEDAVVAVSHCGVCGTDLHVLDGDYPSVRYPIIPGHEFVGTIVALGSRARGQAIGTLVTVDPMLYCGGCPECRRGATNLCRNGGGLGTTANGAFAEYVSVRASQCEPLPPAMDVARAALVEPLACVIHAIDRIGPVFGDRALVIGAGTAGLLMCGALAGAGATVDVLERNVTRLELAPRFGADETASDPSGLTQSGEGWDLVVDATGSAPVIEEALRWLRRGGRLCIFGVAATQATVRVSPFDLFSRELSIIGTTSVRGTFGRAMSLLSSTKLPVEDLLAEPLPLNEVSQALERVRNGHGIKTQIAPRPN